MNCPENFLKYAMCIVNGLFVALGIVMIAVGGLALTQTREYNSLLEDGFFSIPALLLIIGVFVTVLFFFGCHGLKRESYWMVMTFAVLLSVILLMEIIGGVSAYMLRGKTEEAFNVTMTASFKQYNNTTNTENQEMWDAIQKNLHCCGVNGTQDYEVLLKIPVPVSCCIVPNCTTTDTKNLFNTGCGPLVEEILLNSIGMIAKWSLVIAALHLVWIFGACYFAVRFRRGAYETV